MRNSLRLIKDKTLRALEGQLGAVPFEYVLILGGVSVVAVGLLVVGADVMMKQLLIYGLCEQFDDMLPLAGQWPCEFGGSSFWGW